MDMFLYLDKDSFVHRLDPRPKILVLFCTFAIALMMNSMVSLSILALIVIIYGCLSKSLSNLNRIKVVLLMIGILSVVLWSFSTKGETKLLGPITLEGIYYGIASAIKFILMIVAGMIFLSTTKMEEIVEGLVKLKVPYRGAFAFSTALRLVPTIVATGNIIIQAQKSRGLDLESGSFIQRIKKYIPLLIPTFISVIRGTNVFSMALESKGFGYSNIRSNYLELKLAARDYVVMAVIVIMVAATAYLKLCGYGI